MIIAVAGSILKVRESRNATAPTGPNPGNTPTSVPTKDPTKQKSKLFGVSATENPSKTLLRTSTLNSENTRRQRNIKQPGENEIGAYGSDERNSQHPQPILRLDSAQQQNHQQKGAE